MGDLLRDVRQSARRLLHTPGFAVTSMITLGLGIGATTAIFSVVYGVILRPLPYDDPDAIVVIGHGSPSGKRGMPSAAWLHYRDRSTTVSRLAVYVESSASIAGLGEALELGIVEATPSLLGVLGVAPVMGRDLLETDAEPGAPPVALVSHGYWVRHFGADPQVIGKPILEGSASIVAGVLPPGFVFDRPPATVVFGNPFEAPDVIMPLGRLDRATARFGNFIYQGVGRLAPGISPEDVQEELEGLMLEAAEDYPGGFTPDELNEGGYRPRVLRLKDAIVGDLSTVLWMLFGAVGLVLLIAATNVANLFLVRAEDRRDELTIRKALGASRASIARVLLTESVLLAGLGGLLGTAVAGTATAALLGLAPTDVARADGVGLDPAVLIFAACLSIAAGISFGLAPLWRSGRRQASTLAGRRRGSSPGVRAVRSRRLFVTTQVALAAVLLVGSGLLVRTVENLWNVDPGFDGSRTATLKLALSGSLLRAAGRQEAAADAARSRFMLDLVARLRSVPGVEHVSFSADLPLDGGDFHDFIAVEGRLPAGLESATKTLRVFIGPGYFEAIGARLLRGRELETLEFIDQPRSVVVNEAFATSRFPDGDVIGQRVMQWAPNVDPSLDVWYTIVGVVADIREISLLEPSVPTVYLPTIFLPDGDFGMFVSNMIAVVRASGDPGELLPRLREEVQAAHPEIPINSLNTLDRILARSFQHVSFAMTIVLIVAVLALGLGMVGLYATVSYFVGQRTREFGVRIALGASAQHLRRDVLAAASRIGAVGIGVGLGAALLASQGVRSLLFGVSTKDPLVYLAVAVGLFLLVVAASLGPAARAASTDPAAAMRVE